MIGFKNILYMGFRLGKNKVKKITYKYFPKDRYELKEILMEKLAKDKNADLNDINTSQIKDMRYLFIGLGPHNIDISEWDVSKVENMNHMFLNCKNFDCDLSEWNVLNVEAMEAMFDGCASFEGIGLENWDVSNVRNMEWMFYKCDSLKKLPYWYEE